MTRKRAASQCGPEKFAGDRRGVVAMIFALFVVPFMALAGAAVDIGLVLSGHAQLQAAADAAALAAASTVGDADTARPRALAVPELNLPAADHGTVLVSGDVLLGTWDEDAKTFTDGGSSPNAAKVTLYKTSENGNAFDLTFAGIVDFPTIDITADAIAMQSGNGGDACALSLNTTDRAGIDVGGTADVTFNDCDVASNSSDDDALEVSNNASLTANCASLVGDTGAESPEFELTCDEADTGTSAVADPYDGLPSPTAGSCIDTNYKNTSGTDTLAAGTYCGKFEVTGGTVKLGSGTYIIDAGNFSVSGGATLEEVSGGTGVTIILTDSSGGDSPGSVTINGGAIVTLAAPTSGTYSGVLFFQDKSAVSSTKNKFNGGSTTNFTGALYFPKEEIEFTGGNTSGGSDCTQIIAQKIGFSGNSTLNSSCDSAGTTPITIVSTTRLVF